MRIVCPSCQAAYDVPAPVIDARRTLRCARCSADFMPHAECAAATPSAAKLPDAAAFKPFVSLAPALVIVEAPQPEAQSDELDRLAKFTRVNEPNRPAIPAVAAGWVLSVALLVAFGWASLAWRAPIMHAWPPSIRLYAALGYAS